MSSVASLMSGRGTVRGRLSSVSSAVCSKDVVSPSEGILTSWMQR